MSEAWILELLSTVRDVARQNGYGRLAEHLDDGMLVAASEIHDRFGMDKGARTHDGQAATAVRGDFRAGIH